MMYYEMVKERMGGGTRAELVEKLGKRARERWGVLPKHMRGTQYSWQDDAGKKVRMYLDAQLCGRARPLSPQQMAEYLGESIDSIQHIVHKWEKEIENFERFPMCSRCEMRGDRFNPIMETGRCLACEAELNDWPLDKWKANGQFAALLADLGILSDEEIA